MITTGLCGRSGSGKSHKAIELSSRIGADAIIDDGLFIASGRIMEGISAKTVKTKVGAVKTAVFTDDEHARKVREAIALIRPKHILVLGTSEKMIFVICERLGIPAPGKIVQIEDISTEQQIKKAHELREQEGMHVIPVPTPQVRKTFSGFLIDPKRAFKTNETKTKTVIRPTYSYLGSYEIAGRVIDQIVERNVAATPGCGQLVFTGNESTPSGVYIKVVMLAERGVKLRQVAAILQKKISQTVNHMTSFTVLGVEVEVRGFVKA